MKSNDVFIVVAHAFETGNLHTASMNGRLAWLDIYGSHSYVSFPRSKSCNCNQCSNICIQRGWSVTMLYCRAFVTFMPVIHVFWAFLSLELAKNSVPVYQYQNIDILNIIYIPNRSHIHGQSPVFLKFTWKGGWRTKENLCLLQNLPNFIQF